MKKHIYKITVEDISEKQEGNKSLQFEAGSHDDLIDIVERIKSKGTFEGDEAAAFGIGLKLFSSVMLDNKDNPLFESFRPHFGEFMKNLKKG